MMNHTPDPYDAEIVGNPLTSVEEAANAIVELRPREFAELAAHLVASDREAADLLARKLYEALRAGIEVPLVPDADPNA